jgi:hypothetical protein
MAHRVEHDNSLPDPTGVGVDAGRAGDERVRMKAGELWWFNNNMQHEAFNESDDSRIHVIFDVLPRHLIGKVRTVVPRT